MTVEIAYFALFTGDIAVACRAVACYLNTQSLLVTDVAVYVLWLVLPPLQAALAFRMWSNKYYREYPIFFAYTIEQLFRFFVLFYCYRYKSSEIYGQAYTGLAAVEGMLQLGVVFELFADLFRPYAAFRHLGPAIFRWASVFFLFFAIVVAAYSTGADSYRLLNQLFGMQRSLEIVQAGLLLLLVIAALVMAFQWRPRTLGITVGFGVFTVVNLIAFTLRAQWGMTHQQELSIISNAGYDCATIIWVRAFWSKTTGGPGGRPPADWDVSSWNNVLSELLRK